MKAAVFYGPGDIRVEEVKNPVCPEGGALIKLHGSLICGTDMKIYKNGHPKIRPPQIIGHESCGHVVEIDSPSYGVKVGDRVTLQTTLYCGKCEMCQRGMFNLCKDVDAISWSYPGTFAEYIAVPERALNFGNLIKAPDNLTDAEVCLAEPLACVINGQQLLKIVPGESVLVIGAGPIGILHAELARISGAGKVVLAENSQNRLAMARKFEYDGYIDTGRSDLVEEARKATAGRGFDVTIVTAPVAPVQEQAFKTLGTRGRLSLFGSLPEGRSQLKIDARNIHYNEIGIFGASSSTTYEMEKALQILASERFRTDLIITDTLPLEKIVEGIQMDCEGKALKVYLKNN